MNSRSRPHPGSRTLFACRLLFTGFALLALTCAPRVAPAATKKKESPDELVRIDMKRANEILKYHRAPEYPKEAVRARVGGSGRFRLYFGPDGKVKNIAVLQSTGYIVLVHACLWTLVHWQVRHPEEVPVIQVPITFSIGR
jgi:TonB family protein